MTIQLTGGGQITRRHVDSIVNNGYDKWQLESMFTRIKDWFCGTTVDQARKLLHVVMDRRNSVSERIEGFRSLQELASDPYKGNFKQELLDGEIRLSIEGLDDFERTVRYGGASKEDVSNSHTPPSAERSFMDLSLFNAKKEIRDAISLGNQEIALDDAVIGSNWNLIFEQIAGWEFRRDGGMIDGEYYDADSAADELKKFLQEKCSSDFQRAMVSALTSQSTVTTSLNVHEEQLRPAGFPSKAPVGRTVRPKDGNLPPPPRSVLEGIGQNSGTLYSVSQHSAGIVRIDVKYRRSFSDEDIKKSIAFGSQPYRFSAADASFLIGETSQSMMCIAQRADGSDEEMPFGMPDLADAAQATVFRNVIAHR
ncbi:hypothetical protein [Burkholderia sp. Bp8986]|uniref:hypothetical protein n=1 Tax=Burkholderia sp. Bp8986 TaxID=2184550 RepID=UPI000F5A43FF|nr:hypothetical protein [Burkholderia sp. Bp8986]